ncbi:hypothetical protein [Dokdonella sp.]|uniref:hypothetical protein n=1 Tax=Dokdonella sp. TaxID=2291710 RepID=UPI003C5261BA
MYLRYRLSILGAAAMLALGSTAQAASQAAAPNQAPDIRYAVRADVSAPMRDIIRMMPPSEAVGSASAPFEMPNILLKRSDYPTIFAPDYSKSQNSPMGTSAPSIDVSYDALTQATACGGCLPPDTNGDVSDVHYIQTVNSHWAVYEKTTGAVVQGSTPGNSFYVGFGGKCETTNSGDPTALWDARAQRWVISQFVTSAPFAQCVAVSTSPDPLGSYYRYEFQWPIFGDYPKMGVWTEDSTAQNAYTLITHDFGGSPQTFQGASLISLERDKMLVGDPTAAVVRFAGIDAYGVQPVHLSGLNAAPGGSCPSFVHFEFSTAQYRFWDMCLDWETPANTVFTNPPAFIDTDVYVPYGGAIAQLGTTSQLDAFGSNTMYRATARAFLPTAPNRISLVINHVIQSEAGQAGVRWVHFNMKPSAEYPITTVDRIFGNGFDGVDLPNSVPATQLVKSVIDQGNFTPDGDSRWMGGIAIDGSGNIGLGYSKSSATINPKIMITGRTPFDPAGMMRDEVSCTPGTTGSQTSTSGRWGDYASMSVDPVDQCRFYFTTEYLATTSGASWRTRVCSFTFDGCGDPDFSLVNETPARVEVCSATDSDPTWDIRVGVLNGFNGSVLLAAMDVPPGTSGSTSVNPVLGAGTSVFTLSNGASIAAGEYDFSVNGTSGPLTRGTSLELGVSTAAASAPALLSPANNSTGNKVLPTLSWNAAAGALNYNVEIATDVAFSNIVRIATVSGTTWKVTPSLAESTPYYWRVTPNNYCGAGATSVVYRFDTGIIGQCPSGTAATNVFADDFQGGVNGWTTVGTGGTNWTQQTAPAGSGLSTTVWGVPNNATTSDRGLVSPSIAIPANSQATFLTYDTWHNFEDDGPTGCYDNATLDIKVGAGAFTYVHGSSLYTDPYDGIAASNLPNAGLMVWCHTPPSGAITSIVDMDDYVGQSVQLRYRALSDANTVAATTPTGFYIDNLVLKACVPTP